MSEYRTDEAFAPVPLWLVGRVSDRALALYALLSGLRDFGTDMASVGRGMLAERLHKSVDSVDRAKAELVEAGAISVVRTVSEEGGAGRNVYTIHRFDPSRRFAVQEVAASRNGAAPSIQSRLSSSSPPGKSPRTVAGQVVTAEEHALIDAVLSAFNEVSGRNFAGVEWRQKIARRIREHPELDAAAFRRLVEEQFASPWWSGDPSPSVMFGNGEVFDRALNGVRGGRGRHQPELTEDYDSGMVT